MTMTMSCEQLWISALAAGALTAAANPAKTLLSRAGLGPQVHYAVAGVAAKYFCTRSLQPMEQTATVAALGFAGGVAKDRLLPTTMII